MSFQHDVLDLADVAKLQSERAYEQQQQLNQAKDQLILNVNHELRTPLTAVSGYLDLLLTFSEQLDTETRMQFLIYLIAYSGTESPCNFDHILRCEVTKKIVHNEQIG